MRQLLDAPKESLIHCVQAGTATTILLVLAIYLMKEKSIKWCTKDTSKESLDVASKLLERNFPTSIAQLFLDLQGGSKILVNSVAKLRQTVLMRKHSSQHNESTAETLTRVISDDPNVSFVCCAGSYDEANQLVKVCRKRKKKGKSTKTDEKRGMPHDHAQCVKEIVLGVSLGNGEFLLNVTWVNEEVKHHHELHP